MKVWKTFCFELAYQTRRRSTWLYFAAVLGLTLQVGTEAFLGNARTGGYFFNGPFTTAAVSVIGSMFALLVAAAIAGDAATRDMQTRMEPLLYTTPISKAAHLGGRFLGAFAMSALLLAAVPIGLIVAARLPGIEAELIAPFRPAVYLNAYTVCTLPNAFVTTAILFALAALTRRSIASYIGAAILFLLPTFGNEFIAKHLGKWELAQQLDPFGFTVMSALSRAWTPAQKGSQLLALEGILLTNRLLWLGIAVGVLALTYAGFRFAHHTPRTFMPRWLRRSRPAAALSPNEEQSTTPIAVPAVERRFGFGTRVRQMLVITRRSFREIVLSWGAIALAVVVLFLVAAGPELMEHIGIPLHPVTERILAHLAGPGDLPGFMAIFLMVFYAGEVIWRERDAGMSVIADATPVPDWVPFTGKLLGLTLVLVLLQALMMGGGLLTQIRLGHHDFEVGLYLIVLFGIYLSGYLLFTALAVAVHVIVNQKYVGHLVVILAYALTAYASDLGIEHNLLIYGSDPGWDYSDMSGFGPHLAPVLWFKLYWGGWALLFAVVAKLLWPRGTSRGMKERLRLGRGRVSTPARWSLAAAAGVIVLVGSFVFYNTNVLHAYAPSDDLTARRARYEQRHGRYDGVPQPRRTATSLHIELEPARGEADIRGTYDLVNKTAAPIDAIHLATAREVETDGIQFNRPFAPRLVDKQLGHRIYTLKEPLQPGDSLRMQFRVRFRPRGFTNGGVNDRVASNGTHFEGDWLPAIGYQPDRELSNAGERKLHGLPARPPLPRLEDARGRNDETRGERIAFEAVIGTAANETAVAPGTLRRTWRAQGRHYFHYATDTPIRPGFAIFSADYAVHRARWRDVDIEVLHHRGHPWNVERIVKGVQASLESFTKDLGPYPHQQIRLVEAPGSSIGLRSHPINIRFFEGFALLNSSTDDRNVDFPFAVVAHEVAHQWWGNQLTPANVEGAALLSESLSWYSAMNAVDQTYGPEHLGRFLDILREAYLHPRGRADVPLLRADDWFVGYRKGPFAMYALREYVGEKQVTLALRRLMDKHRNGTAPLPTTLDLYAELKAVTPEPLRYLLVDLFEVNTFWELSTKAATAEPASGGAWRVTLNVAAKKVAVNTEGAETVRPMNDLIEIGVFAAEGKPLYLRQHRIKPGQQTVTVTVPGKPARAGIDPRNILIDTVWRDNTVEVTTGK